MLDVKQVKTTKKKEALSPKHFGLFYGSSQWKGATVSKQKVYEYLKVSANRGTKVREKINEDMGKNILEAKKATSRTFKLEDSEIVSQFTLVRHANKINVDYDKFLIKASYLPDDEEAPNRIYDIVKEFHDILNDFFDTAATEMLELQEKEPIDPNYTGLTAGYDDNGEMYVAYQENGELYEELRDQIPVTEVINMWFYYKVTYPKYKSEQLNKVYTSPVGKKHLKKAQITFNNGFINIENLEDYNEEVQTVISEIIDYFSIQAVLE